MIPNTTFLSYDVERVLDHLFLFSLSAPGMNMSFYSFDTLWVLLGTRPLGPNWANNRRNAVPRLEPAVELLVDGAVRGCQMGVWGSPRLIFFFGSRHMACLRGVLGEPDAGLRLISWQMSVLLSTFGSHVGFPTFNY